VEETVLVPTLIGHDLVDAFPVMLDLQVVGGGKRSFRDDDVRSGRYASSTAR
jgi:hypothetical protein